MENTYNDDELHPIIQQALFKVDMIEYQVGMYKNFLESDIESRKKWELSEDETEWNQNSFGIKWVVDDVTFNETLEHLRSYQRKLEDAKILLRIYMKAFNKGWLF